LILFLKKIQLLSYLLIIPSLITKGFLPDFFLSLTTLLFIFFSIFERNFVLYKDKFFIFLIIWNLYLIILSILSDNILLSLESSLFYFRFTFFSLATQYILMNNNNIFKYLFISILLPFILLISDSYFQYFNGSNILGYPYLGDRLSSFFKDEFVLGSYLSRLLPLFFVFTIIVFGKKKEPYIICLFFLIIIDVLIYVSGERSAFFNLLLFTVILIIFSNSFKLLRFLTFIVSLSILLLISFQNSNIKERMINKTLNQTNITSVLEVKDEKQKKIDISKIRIFSPEHQILYLTSWEIFKKNPLIGIGPKLFREYCNKDQYYRIVSSPSLGEFDSCSTHSHNTYVQLLSETGIFGTLPVFSVFLYLCYKLLKHFFKKIIYKVSELSDLEIILMSSFIITLWPIIPTGNFFGNWLSIIYYFPIGIYIYIKKNKIK